ncbi:MAG: hypothetical protein VX954_02015 [Candidatus Thermoplasmatota archaeon]|nr:hypothetical protein [Candidatus Thermoplasmatota archaeon]
MNTLGRGRANGAISILHSLGLGRGCSIGIGIETEVALVDERSDISADSHNLLNSIETCWRSEGLPLPDKIGWKVTSDIPIGQGLKSSSALACAAIRAMNESAWTNLSENSIVDLAVKSQRLAKCTITGSMDDTWASISPGWKLVDPSLDASSSVIIEGLIDESFSVLICLRGNRNSVVSSSSFLEQEPLFQRSLASIMRNSPLDSISTNGMAVAVATEDFDALRICNLCIAKGALASGISGSGPAISIVCYEDDSKALEEAIIDMGFDVIKTKFSTSETLIEEAF